MGVDPNFVEVEREGHVFRSELLNQFARIEAWVVERSGELGLKLNRNPLGQKIKSLRSSADRFRKPKRIAELADRVEDVLKLRGDIVHAAMQTAKLSCGEPVWLFHNVADTEGKQRFACTAMNRSIFKAQINELKMLIKELNDQQLTARAPADRAATSATASSS